MSGILLTSVSGLQAAQQMLDVVGNNLANSNTTGYQSQSVQFSDLMYQTLQAASVSSSTTVGGTDPIQVGSGVQVAGIASDLQQGTLQQTGNPLDVAIQGNGYFVVNNGTQDLYTLAGSFGVDANNNLVDPTTGYLVQRFGTVGTGSATSPAFQATGSNDIQIPYGSVVPGQATTSVTLLGNLDATDSGPVAQTLTSAQPFLSGGAPATTSTLLNSLDDNTTPYVTGDTLTITGATTSGTPVNTTFAVGPATTLGDLVSAINADFPGSTASIDSSGNLVVTASSAGPSQLALSISDTPGDTGATSWINHAETVTATGQNGATVTSSVQIFDPQGGAHTLSLVFEKQGNNTWNLTGSLPNGDGTITNGTITGITFNANGSFGQVNGGNGTSMTIAFPNQTTPQQLAFSLGTPNGFGGLTQVGASSSVSAPTQNGYAAGSLSTVSIANDGTITGVFSNGQTFPIAQLALATFSNPGGLSRQGQNYYALTTDSGSAILGPGASGGAGTVVEGQLEGSNVDISLEFTNLIIAQQGYEANAKALSVADQVLQDLDQIIH
jgi:flagellar hook protein FlgE